MYHPRYHPRKNVYLVIFLWYLWQLSLFEQEPLLKSSALISNAIDTQLCGVHYQKTQVYLKPMAINVTTPTYESVNTGHYPCSTSTCFTSLQINQVILTKLLYPISHQTHFHHIFPMACTESHHYTPMHWHTTLIENQSSISLSNVLLSRFDSPATAYHLNKLLKSFNIFFPFKSFFLIFLSILCSCGPLRYFHCTITIYLLLI